MSDAPKTEGLSLDDCRARAQECLELARRISNDDHRKMLLQIAETWLRIGTTQTKE